MNGQGTTTISATPATGAALQTPAGAPLVNAGPVRSAGYTAKEIADCLQVKPQYIRKLLSNVPPSHARIIRGNETAAWYLSSLPESLRGRLATEASRQGYRTAEAMLSGLPGDSRPAPALDKICEADIDYATKLRLALRPWLARRHDRNLSSADMEAQGIADYARQFGRAITPRYWRKLMALAVHRDAGAMNWDRLKNYLPKNPKLKEPPQGEAGAATADEFSEIESYINACRNPASPSEIEQRHIWTMAFEKHAEMMRGGTGKKRAARLVREFLFSRAAFLAPSREALLKAFKRKLALFTAANGDPKALRDRREENGGDGFEFPQEDLDLIEHKIVFQYGEYAQAWHDALAGGQLSPETRLRYGRAPSRKSHVPQKLIATLGKRPLWLYVLHNRRKDFNSLKAHFDSVYDGLGTLACISADDVTLPVYFSYQRPDGTVQMTRGQCLVFIDLVSRRILGYSLQPDPNYNALVIYTECARVFSEKGVPRSVLFERGIWERAKIITGSAPHSITEVTQGLRQFGIEIFHTHTPQGKHEVEKCMALIQDLMEGEPGYCGRDERKDLPDRTKRALSEVRAGKCEPAKHFYDFDQWNFQLRGLFEQYNKTPQGGQHMRGRSPDQVYVDEWPKEESRQPVKMGPELRYLFAHAKYEVDIELSGFYITSGNRRFKYFGDEISDLRLVGHKMLAWFDPEFPDVAVITDMKSNNPIAVPLHKGPGRLAALTDPDGTALADACARREAQASKIVAHYNVLKDKFELPYRKNLATAQDVYLGMKINAAKENVRKAATEQSSRVHRAQERARRLKIPTAIVRDDPTVLEGLSDWDEARREHNRQKNQTEKESAQ